MFQKNVQADVWQSKGEIHDVTQMNQELNVESQAIG